MIDKRCLVAAVLLAAMMLTGCDAIQNYDEVNEPRYASSYAKSQPDDDGQIKAISWNVKFGQEIDAVVAELTEVEELQGADLILLQEMDEQGVDTIAQALQYNYVYFPASIHTRHDKNFGNAILSPWPISNPMKLALPFENPRNRQIRIAVRAMVMVGDKEVLAYSVHTETPWLSHRKRLAQIESLVKKIDDETDYVVVGGDFNTFTPKNIVDLEQRFELAGLERVSTGAGATFESGGIEFTLDHIFAKGLSATDNGVWAETQASDHFPLWVDMTFDEDPPNRVQAQE